MDHKVNFDTVVGVTENTLRELIDNTSHGDIFTELKIIEVLITAISNITNDYFEKRQKISEDALLRLWDISNYGQKAKIVMLLKDQDLYENIEFEFED